MAGDMAQADFDFLRPPDAEIAALAGFSSSTLHEAIGQTGALAAAVKPIAGGMRACGPALTVDCPAGDNLMIHAAIAGARPGDLLVVDHKGAMDDGPFGEVMATACRARGIVGLVIDGCVRDSVEIRDMGFPVFARGLCIRGTTKIRRGGIGGAIDCAGVRVMPGDVVLGDADGVVVIPRDRAAEAARAAAERVAREAEMMDRIRAGATTVDLLGLGARLRDD